MNTDRMSCGEAREKLPLFVGGDLDRDVLEAVRSHVETCGTCAERAAQATRARRELVSAFRSREADVANPELWPGIRAALRTEGLIRDGDRPLTLPATARRSGVRRARWAWALAPLAAAAAVVAIVELSGLSVGNSIPVAPPAGVPPSGVHDGRIVERSSEPTPTVPVGLQPVPADEENTRLYPFGVPRTQRVQGAPPGAPIYSVGLRPFH